MGQAREGRMVSMENLAKAIVDSVQIFGQLLDQWANNQVDITNNVPVPVGDTISSVFSNFVSFLAQLTSEIIGLI
jgi:hypothetical protein